MRRLPLVAPLMLLVACSGGAPDGEPIGSSSDALTTVPPGPNKVLGIDVSHYQGTIDWNAEKAAGRRFGVASVGDGLYQDPTFATNWAHMKSAGVIRGAYQFFEPGIDPIAQADILVAKVGRLGAGDLPATIDVEVTGGQSPATIAARVKKWLDRVEAGTGKKPIIYTGPYFWQDNVQSTAFGAYPLWIADYGVSAPLLPAPWKKFRIWQYSDSNGTLDLDRFDGTLAELEAFAGPTDAAPKGYLDAADCKGLGGWAQDPDSPAKAIDVRLTFDGPSGTAGAPSLTIGASSDRSDLCKPLGSCNHAFTLPVPRGLADGAPHKVFAYGLDAAGGADALLTNAPKSFTCAAPDAPYAPPKGIRRHVTSPKSLAAWKLSTLLDLAHWDDARVGAYTQGDDLPDAPEVVQGDDGAPEVWVIDEGKRRHVVSPASMAAWRFGAPAKKPAADLAALPQGPDFPSAPFLVKGTDAAVYAIDLSPETPPGTEAPNGAASASTADPTVQSALAGDAPSGAAGGCAVVGPRRRDAGARSGALAALGAVALAAARKRLARRCA